MATIEYYGVRTSDMAVTVGAGRLLEYGDNFAVIASLMSPDTVLFRGSDFQYAEGKLAGGIVSEIVYKTTFGDSFRITNISYDLSLGVPPTGVPDVLGGDDLVIGSSFRDSLFGYYGNDLILGGQGEDHIRGGGGDDTLRGGGKSDTFIFQTGDGSDRILDFDASGRNQDYLGFASYEIEGLNQLHIRERSGNLVIGLGSEQKIILRDIDLEDLSESNFIFY